MDAIRGRPISLYLAVVSAVFSVVTLFHIIALTSDQVGALTGLASTVLFLIANSHAEAIKANGAVTPPTVPPVP